MEGDLDEAVLRRLSFHVGGTVRVVYGKQGKRHLQQRISAYNQAARFAQWVVFVDLDHDADCAPDLLATWLPRPADFMHLRVAVREVEAWLLADRERIAGFLSVAQSRVPPNPETLDDPKRFVVDLATRSHRTEIRRDMTPRLGSGRQVGPAYSSRLIEFVNDDRDGWRPEVAAHNSDSLNRCLLRLREVFGSTT